MGEKKSWNFTTKSFDPLKSAGPSNVHVCKCNSSFCFVFSLWIFPETHPLIRSLHLASISVLFLKANARRFLRFLLPKKMCRKPAGFDDLFFIRKSPAAEAAARNKDVLQATPTSPNGRNGNCRDLSNSHVDFGMRLSLASGPFWFRCGDSWNVCCLHMYTVSCKPSYKFPVIAVLIGFSRGAAQKTALCNGLGSTWFIRLSTRSPLQCLFLGGIVRHTHVSGKNHLASKTAKK